MDKGIVIEYDFTVIDGAQILFDTAKAFFEKLDNLPFDPGLEARFLCGQNYLAGLTAYFQFVKTKKTPAKASKDLPAAFQKAITAKIQQDGLPKQFVTLVKELEQAGVAVAVTTRANLAQVKEVFDAIASDRVNIHFENSVTYGNVKRDAWMRAAEAIGTIPGDTMVVTGSGFGVKSALQSRFSVMGVSGKHTSWQDYSGADVVVEKLDGNAFKRLVRAMKLKV